MPSATDLINEFPDDEVTTNDDDSDDTTDVDDTTVDDGNDGTNDDSDDSDDADDDTVVTNDDDDGGFFADEDGNDDDSATTELPAAPANFSAEEKYIIDNLPLITVRVIMADDSVKSMQVRSAADLPRDMKGIATPYEDKQFDLANAAQETRARELQTYYRNHQNTVQAKEFEVKENQAIRDDIAELQRDGEIPKFKAQPGTRAFNDDPAAKIVQETIEFMNDRNAKYLEKANAGGTYRRLGFAEAFELMNGNGKAKIDNKDSAARRDAAGKLLSKRGGSSKDKPKAPIAGRTIKEVAAEFDDFEV